MAESPYPGDSLQRLQTIELELLAVMDELCRENGFDYFISGGTCLGAMRHGGFIPWDDDVDVNMPKEDYDRFLEIAPKILPEGYSLSTSMNTKGASALWAKIFKDGTKFIDDNAYEAGCEQGVFLDVFPTCKVDADPRKAKKQFWKARMAQVQSYLKHFSNPKITASGLAKSIGKQGSRLVHRSIARTWKQADLQYSFDHAFDTGTPTNAWIDSANAKYLRFPDEVFFPTTDIKFENLTLRAPHDCEKYLTLVYGDYMQLPPENERYTHAPRILDLGDGIDVMDKAAYDSTAENAVSKATTD